MFQLFTTLTALGLGTGMAFANYVNLEHQRKVAMLNLLYIEFLNDKVEKKLK